MLRHAAKLAHARARESGQPWFVSVFVSETEERGVVFGLHVASQPDETGDWVIGCRPDGTRFQPMGPAHG